MPLKLPIGIDDFAKVIEGAYVYVDKTLLVEEVLDQSAEVLLITRPRRFGKTLNLSMLAHFFDHRGNGAALFQGLAVARRPYFAQQGRFPVLFLSFKDLKARTYELFLHQYREMISRHFRAHGYLAERLDPLDRRDFEAFASGEEREAFLSGALARLLEWMYRYHGTRVMLLIDEYDSPIHEGHGAGYYDQIIHFMRVALGRALKGNTALEKAVLSGILRVAKESIFSDLNNVRVYSVLETPFADKFGFTEAETASLQAQAGPAARQDAVRDWYNGYRMGDVVIYNPWSLLNYLADPEQGCRPYWINTSANMLIQQQLIGADTAVQDTLKSLLAGSVVETFVDEHTVFPDMTRNEKTLWSFLLFCGYLTVREKTLRHERAFYTLAVPNKEVMLLFRDIFQDFMRARIGETKTRALLAALVEGDDQRFGEYLTDLVGAILSFYDTGGKTPERVYHTFVLGLLAHLTDRYTIRSNREAGMGRYDVLMMPLDPRDRGIVMEFKAAPEPGRLDACLTAALAQIETRGYARDLQDAGIARISAYAVAFCGKDVAVRATHTDAAPPPS